MNHNLNYNLCIKRILPYLILFFFLSSGSVFAQIEPEKSDKKVSNDELIFKHNQFVMVTLKDGSEVPARISSVKSKKQYWVRMWGGNRKGLVNRKHLRKMSKEEIETLKSKKSSSSSLDQ